MTAQKLPRVMKCYRIGDPNGAFPIFDGMGSTLAPGRWNTPASRIIYTSEHYSTAMLEKLVHGSGSLPPNQHYIEITLPNGLSYEVLNPAHLAGWDNAIPSVSKAYGETWQQTLRSAVLLVPSVVARLDNNILVNPDHPEFPQIVAGLHIPVWWDNRLFGSVTP